VKISLVNFTPRPVETMLFAFKNMHGSIPDSLDDLFEDGAAAPPDLRKEFLEYCAAGPLTGGIQEFVSTVWALKGVSRALQQQLTRHRTAAYSIQSLRIVERRKFASDGDFIQPPRTSSDDLRYWLSMKAIEVEYNRLLNEGFAAEDARGVLPLNITSPITMSISLRGLSSLLSARLCRLTQGEFRRVGEEMIEEVCRKMGEEFRCFFSAPCEKTGFCPHPECCGYREPFPSVRGKLSEKIRAFVKD